MTVFFRADGSQQIGVGHITRCLALAGQLKKSKHEVAFISRLYEQAIIARIRAGGFPVHIIPVESSKEEDLEGTIAVTKGGEEKAVLVIDQYELDSAYQKTIKESGLSLVLIDDLAHGRCYADLVLNQNIYANDELYSVEPYTRLLLGPRYALLREEFALWRRPSKTVPERARHILVTLGGSDPRNQTLKVIQAIASLHGNLEAIVVTGCGYAHHESLERYLADRQDRFLLHMDVDSMAELMCWSDLAVSAGGSTCWELACLGVPNVILTLADNQRQNSLELGRAGISVDLGWWEDVSTEVIAGSLQQLIEDAEARRRMSEAGRALIDGQGVSRVAKAIEEL